MPLDSRTSAFPRVGVVVLNYNDRALAETCLRSVMKSTSPNKDTILVDHASTDGSAEYLRVLFPSILILGCPVNIGSVRARNRGFHEAIWRGNDYILSLDNDAHIDAHLIEELVAVGASDRLWRNSAPPLNACLPFDQLNESAYV